MQECQSVMSYFNLFIRENFICWTSIHCVQKGKTSSFILSNFDLPSGNFNSG